MWEQQFLKSECQNSGAILRPMLSSRLATTAMLDGDAFWHSGGAGGVHDVGQVTGLHFDGRIVSASRLPVPRLGYPSR